MTDKEYILNNLDDRTLFEQLAEESAELSQAALKFIRAAEYSNNPTPVTKQVAKANLEEELQDVLCVCVLLGILDIKNIELSEEKLKRWAYRIAGRADTPKGATEYRIFSQGNFRECSHCHRVFQDSANYCPSCGRYFGKRF